MKGAQCDEEQAAEFLKALTGEHDHLVTFQTFDDNVDRKDLKLAAYRHGKLSDAANRKFLNSRQKQGAGAFVMVNEGDGAGRKTENVSRVRALFLDTDGAPMEPARDRLKPHIVVESSPGKYHLYWIVSDCPLAQFGMLQKAIAVEFGGDPSVHDLPRVMRLPGFLHQKSTPVMTRLISAEDFSPYTTSDVIAGLGLNVQTPDKASSHSRNPPPPYPPRAVNDQTGGSGFELVDPDTGEIFNLKDWAVKHPDFRIATALSKYGPADILRGSFRDGKQHFCCPFDHEHSEQGFDTATYCMDGENAKTKGFVVRCLHAHCTGRDRLDFVKGMLVNGWLSFAALTDQRFLADVRRPRKIYYLGEELQKKPGFSLLAANEIGQFIYLFLHLGCFIYEGGAIPDDPKRICKLLEISPDKWAKLRDAFINVGLCCIDDGRLRSDIFSSEYDSAQRAYNEHIRRARKGGSSKQQNDKEAPA